VTVHVEPLAPPPPSEPAWVLKSVGAPTPRYGASIAFDVLRGEIVLFGGQTGAVGAGVVVVGDTWVWNGSTWIRRFTAHSPSPRLGGAMVYDAARGEVVLFGGTNFVSSFADTWVWNGTDWLDRTSPSTRPTARAFASAAFDEVRREMVLFGGGDRLSDTWAWNGTTWTRRFPATSPPGRVEAAMTYDVVRSQVVLFGGSVAPANTVNGGDTWVWDGSSWTQKFPVVSPPGRSDSALAYDRLRDQVVLFGGYRCFLASCVSDDTWVWDGGTWAMKSPATSPPARAYHSMTFDSARGQLVVFGGLNSTNALLSDTWVR